MLIWDQYILIGTEQRYGLGVRKFVVRIPVGSIDICRLLTFQTDTVGHLYSLVHLFLFLYVFTFEKQKDKETKASVRCIINMFNTGSVLQRNEEM